jgi:DNA-binding MarR family transcriptional regulator
VNAATAHVGGGSLRCGAAHDRAQGPLALMRFLDRLDRARLTPMDVLLLLRLADAEVTVLQLADELDRRAADVRSATAGLVARGLVRRRSDGSARWGLVLTATPRGIDALRRLQPPSEITVPGPRGRTQTSTQQRRRAPDARWGTSRARPPARRLDGGGEGENRADAAPRAD